MRIAAQHRGGVREYDDREQEQEVPPQQAARRASDERDRKMVDHPIVADDRKAESEYPQPRRAAPKCGRQTARIDGRRRDVDDQKRQRDGEDAVADRCEPAQREVLEVRRLIAIRWTSSL